MGMVACPELTASSCPALGVRCERFEVISAVGQCGLGAGAVGQLSRSVISQQLHERALGAPSSSSPLGP